MFLNTDCALVQNIFKKKRKKDNVNVIKSTSQKR